MENKKPFKRYSEEEIQDLKSISILEYAKEVLGFNIITKGKSCTIEGHNSVIITPSQNLWNRFSDSDPLAGGGIINFVRYWEQCSYGQALEKLYQHKNNLPRASYEIREKGDVTENMPDKDDNIKTIYAFLIKQRGLEPKIISDWIKNKNLYQSVTNRDCVFVGSFKGNPMYSTKVSTRKNKDGKFDKYDVLDSVKEVGIYQNNNSKTVMVFESAMDCMAYQSLQELQGKNYKDKNYLVCGGSTTAASCLRFNMTHFGKEIENIVLSLDNDTAGQKGTKICIDMIKDGLVKGKVDDSTLNVFKNKTYDIVSSETKDWNDDLKKYKLEKKLYDVLKDALGVEELGTFEQFLKDGTLNDILEHERPKEHSDEDIVGILSLKHFHEIVDGKKQPIEYTFYKVADPLVNDFWVGCLNRGDVGDKKYFLFGEGKKDEAIEYRNTIKEMYKKENKEIKSVNEIWFIAEEVNREKHENLKEFEELFGKSDEQDYNEIEAWCKRSVCANKDRIEETIFLINVQHFPKTNQLLHGYLEILKRVYLDKPCGNESMVDAVTRLKEALNQENSNRVTWKLKPTQKPLASLDQLEKAKSEVNREGNERSNVKIKER